MVNGEMVENTIESIAKIFNEFSRTYKESDF